MIIERFEDIEVWQLARELTRKVYRLTKNLDEEYLSPNEFEVVYEQTRRTSAAVRGFINYLKKYDERKPTVNREPDHLSIYEKTILHP